MFSKPFKNVVETRVAYMTMIELIFGPPGRFLGCSGSMSGSCWSVLGWFLVAEHDFAAMVWLLCGDTCRIRGGGAPRGVPGRSGALQIRRRGVPGRWPKTLCDRRASPSIVVPDRFWR